jgi:hypothetical protein
MRKATLNSVVSVRPSAWKKLGTNWADFCEIWYLKTFRKAIEKIQISFKSDHKK